MKLYSGRISCAIFSLFVLLGVSVGTVTNFILLQEPVYARNRVGKLVVGGLKFVGKEITSGLISNWLSGEEKQKPSSRSNRPTLSAPRNVSYVGSFFQCSQGCKYFWDRSSWYMFDERNNNWVPINQPPAVIRTHDLYWSSDYGYNFQKNFTKHGYHPQYGWVRW
jgi:hypothetical protein